MTVVNEQEPKKRNWLWIGLGAAALFCLCAVAVAVFMFYRVGKQVADSTQTDPAEAAKAAHEIVDSYELPAGYQERMAMNIMFYSFVMIGPENSANGPIIMLAQFASGSGVSQEQMEQQLRQSFEQQAGNRGMDMHLVEAKKMTIRGNESEVAIYEGTDQSGNTVRQLITSFPGKGGTAMLMIMGDAQDWDQTEVDNFINSIK
jgi:hypothetical protein